MAKHEIAKSSNQEQNAIAPPPSLTPSELERLVVGGDLSVLGPDAKARHYLAVCAQLGLTPATKPLAYIRLNGREVLYALRDCTDQLRRIHNVRIEIVARERHDDIYAVTARASLPSGRQDESIGAVPIAGLKGEALANALMKAETKAKRRATLSLCGLGVLDETEVVGQAFAELPREQPPPAPIVVEAAPDRAPPKAHPARAELPPIPDQITAIPEWFCARAPALRRLVGVPISAWSLADAELVRAESIRVAGVAKTDDGRRWAEAIAADASIHEGQLRMRMDADDPSVSP